MTAQTHLLFSTPVIVDELDDAEAINAALVQLIERRRGLDEGIARSNLGGWHSNKDFTDWGDDAGRKVTDRVLQLARDYTGRVEGSPAPEWWAHAWANVSGAGALNRPHVHGGAFWSAVYYVRSRGSDSGKLVLHDPRMPGLRMYAPTLRFKNAGPEQVVRLKPKEGMIIMFPSWLMHSVDPWEGEGERISIAYNIFARPPLGDRRVPGAALDD